MKYFLCTYTNKVKRYCDEVFFERFNSFGKESIAVDNTIGLEYYERLKTLTANVEHIDIEEQPKETQFQRNVAESANVCRDAFLKTDCDLMLIIESDVLPPVGLISMMDRAITKLPKSYSALGALYYTGFHDYTKEGIHKTHHCLSGCTAYKRDFIEKFPFRWSYDNLGAFPDAWAAVDAGDNGYTQWNDHDIRCEHLSNGVYGRYSEPL